MAVKYHERMFTEWTIIMVRITKREEYFCPWTCQKVDAGASLDTVIPRKACMEAKKKRSKRVQYQQGAN